MSLEYPITNHCNLSCIHCDHASPLLPTSFADLNVYHDDLTALAAVLVTRDFRVIGGEPLLHPKLMDFLQLARESGIGERITLVTNGTLLREAPRDLWSMIDRLWLSVYPKMEARMDVKEIQRLCHAHNVVFDRRDISAFRQTIVNSRIDDTALVQRIFDTCKNTHEWHCFTAYRGLFYKCAVAPSTPTRLGLRGTQFDASGDAVAIHHLPSLRERLEAYLSDRTPLASCRFCLGSSGVEMPLRQLKRAEIVDAIHRDDRPIVSLLDDAKR